MRNKLNKQEDKEVQIIFSKDEQEELQKLDDSHNAILLNEKRPSKIKKTSRRNYLSNLLRIFITDGVSSKSDYK